MIRVKYLMVDALSPHNVIMGRHALNLLLVVLSTLHLSLKYLLPEGWVGLVQGGDQEVAQEFY